MGFDCIVVGGGHAGCESALVCARKGLKTLLLTMKLDKVGQLSCNPSMGGLGKSQLIFEVDALGGEIGYATDRTGIGFKMLNTKKGPAVWSLRAQVDSNKYREVMQGTIAGTTNLTAKEEEVVEILVENPKSEILNPKQILNSKSQCSKDFSRSAPKCAKAVGVRTWNGKEYFGSAIIVTAGTFLMGLIHIGMKHYSAGRLGEPPSVGLSNSLRGLGFEMGRLKTGTSPRVDGRTVDFTQLVAQVPDMTKYCFSHRTIDFNPPAMPCYITHTNKRTRDIVLKNLDRSPLYQGIIVGKGPRYCPSIEDKSVKFSDKESHQVFIEPEGLDTNEHYLNGLSTSLPLDVQVAMLHTISGLEEACITKPGYGIEYDFIYPYQVYPTLEAKRVKNLWFAGQMLGTSGYEEAAAQGMIAGINAGLRVQDSKAKTHKSNESSRVQGFVLRRGEGYIGVLIDDLVTKEISEPYRMFTSRVEHRLILRQDNASERLMKYGVEFGLVNLSYYAGVEKIISEVRDRLKELKSHKVYPEDVNSILGSHNSSLIRQPTTIFQLLKRPELNLQVFEGIVGVFDSDVRQQIEIQAKYDGYIEREEVLVKRVKELEDYEIPVGFDYSGVKGLSHESLEKLCRFRPLSVGQASRIAGVRFSDITCLLMALKR